MNKYQTTQTDYSYVGGAVFFLALIAGSIAFDVWLYKKLGAKYFFMLLAINVVLSTAVIINKSKREE